LLRPVPFFGSLRMLACRHPRPLSLILPPCPCPFAVAGQARDAV
jgi:hypothetical protein